MGGTLSQWVFTVPWFMTFGLVQMEIKKYLISQMTSQNHKIGRTNNFMSKRSLWYVTTLPSLVAIGIVIAEICFYWL